MQTVSDQVALIVGQELATKNSAAGLGTYLIRKNEVMLLNLESPAVDNRDSGLTGSSSGSEYERPPKRGGKGQGVRAAVLQEKETLKNNGQRTSQQEMSDKPSNNTGPARLEMDEYEGNDMQVDDEGMRGDEEREAMERTETKKRRNEASKAVENSTKRKTHEKGNNPSLERYVTCDVAFAGFVSHRHGSHSNSHLFHSLLQTASKKTTSLACICKPSLAAHLGRSSQLGTQPPY